jgi:integrase
MSVATSARISKRIVDGIVPPEAGETRIWDTEVKGFFLRVYSTGRRVYALKYRNGSAQRILTIGTHGSPWTAEKARERAVDALDANRHGEDPAVEKKEARLALTVKQLIDSYLEDGPATKPGKRASTWANDASNLRHHIEPQLGRKMAASVTREDAARAISAIGAGKTATQRIESGRKRGRTAVRGGQGIARRTRLTAAAMFAWGLEHRRIKGANPFAGVKLPAAPVRERFLSQLEAARLLAALTDLEGEHALNPTFGDAIRLLLLTGARKTEILGLKWSEIDLERKLILLPPARTKAGGSTGARRIALSPPALEIIERRRREHAGPSGYVFPAASGDGHAIGIRRAFKVACARAELSGVRIHDLRHSFASFAVADGASLFLVGKLLGHASARTTERYAHLSGDPLQDAVAAIGRTLIPTGPGPTDSSQGRAAD